MLPTSSAACLLLCVHGWSLSRFGNTIVFLLRATQASKHKQATMSDEGSRLGRDDGEGSGDVGVLDQAPFGYEEFQQSRDVELDHFRRQWQAELNEQQQGRQQQAQEQQHDKQQPQDADADADVDTSAHSSTQQHTRSDAKQGHQPQQKAGSTSSKHAPKPESSSTAAQAQAQSQSSTEQKVWRGKEDDVTHSPKRTHALTYKRA